MDQQSESDLPGGAQERVGEDIHCRNCGYNLRTLSTGGVCPECGESVAVSTRRDLLCEADPKWLSMVRMGLAMSAGGCLLWSMEEFERLLPLIVRSWVPISKLNSFGFVLTAAGAWAAFPIGAIDCLRPSDSRYRDWMRGLFTMMLCVYFMDWLLVNFGRVVLPTTYSHFLNVTIISFTAIAIALEIQILGAMAKRVPDGRLANWAHICKWCVPAAAAFYLPLLIGTSYTAEGNRMVLRYLPYNVLVGVWHLAILLTGVGWLASGIYLAWMGKVVGNQMRVAAIHAATPTAKPETLKPET